MESEGVCGMSSIAGRLQQAAYICLVFKNSVFRLRHKREVSQLEGEDGPTHQPIETIPSLHLGRLLQFQ